MSCSAGLLSALACSCGLWSYSGSPAPIAVPVITPDCNCHCERPCAVYRDEVPDRAVLDLLRGQLDRCGPDQLKGQACNCPPPHPCPRVFQRGALELVVGGFCVGPLVGAPLAWPTRPRLPTQSSESPHVEEEVYRPRWFEREERPEPPPLALTAPATPERRLHGKQAGRPKVEDQTYVPPSRR